MTTRTIILCAVVVLSWSIVSAHDLVPPKGFSLGFTGKVAKGTQKYTCKRGSWVKTGSSAVVYAADGSKLGNYWSKYNPSARAVTYFWKIFNSHGNTLESGHSASTLQSSQLKAYTFSANDIPQYLAIVNRRIGSGDSDHVAFIALTGTKGGMPPKKALCTSDGVISGVPFYGVFKFYTQDREPPKSIPASIKPKGTFVQVVFLEGKMMYKFSAGRWRYQGFFATMFEFAGGKSIGKVGNVARSAADGSNLLWKFNDPNGFWFLGRQYAPAVQVSRDGCPWRLMKITRSGGTQSPFGAYKFALMAGTLGGQMPKLAARTDGMTWGSRFTGLFYLYAQ